MTNDQFKILIVFLICVGTIWSDFYFGYKWGAEDWRTPPFILTTVSISIISVSWLMMYFERKIK